MRVAAQSDNLPKADVDWLVERCGGRPHEKRKKAADRQEQAEEKLSRAHNGRRKAQGSLRRFRHKVAQATCLRRTTKVYLVCSTMDRKQSLLSTTLPCAASCYCDGPVYTETNEDMNQLLDLSGMISFNPGSGPGYGGILRSKGRQTKECSIIEAVGGCVSCQSGKL